MNDIITLCSPSEALKAIREHRGICTVRLVGPLGWPVAITKIEAQELVKHVTDDMEIHISISDDQLEDQLHVHISDRLH